ncbi:hypothetical protein B296_00034392 [Ensete ventricosum]|uniref:Uncharacterized protein n=1 Tax=Ensete ventricosum TaxID=4639 RepID=A0A427A8S8_ENSVE|nr:hypothetical protein B296_00034392 [Ensete ventricosum]
MLLTVDALSNAVGSISDLLFMLWRMSLSPPTIGGEPKVWCYCRYPPSTIVLTPAPSTVASTRVIAFPMRLLGRSIRSLSFPSSSQYSSPCHLLGFHTLDQARHFLAYYHRTLDLRYTPPLLSCPWPPLLVVFLHR